MSAPILSYKQPEAPNSGGCHSRKPWTALKPWGTTWLNGSWRRQATLLRWHGVGSKETMGAAWWFSWWFNWWFNWWFKGVYDGLT